MFKLLTWPIRFFFKILILILLIFIIFNFIPKKINEETVLHLGEKDIPIEIVESDSDRAKGLSGRYDLSGGMLFVMEKEDYHGIWMKDMKISIDIIWLDESYVVVDIEERVAPDTYPEVFKPEKEALYVLEVNAGFVEENGLKVGDVFTW